MIKLDILMFEPESTFISIALVPQVTDIINRTLDEYDAGVLNVTSDRVQMGLLERPATLFSILLSTSEEVPAYEVASVILRRVYEHVGEDMILSWRDPHEPRWNFDLTSENLSDFIDGGERLEQFQQICVFGGLGL